jgi:hypothetical protein
MFMFLVSVWLPLSPSRQMWRQYLKTGLYHFTPHPSQFIVQYDGVVPRCSELDVGPHISPAQQAATVVT